MPGARVGGREVECSGYGSGPSEVSAGSKGGGRRIPAFVRRNVRLPHHIANPAHSGCDPLSSPSCSRRRCGAHQPVSPPRAPPECHIETRRRRVRIRYRVERPHRRTCDGRGSSRDAEACTRRAEFSTPSEVPAQIREHTGRDERPPLGVRGDRGGASAYFGSLVRASRFSRAFAIAGPSDRPVSGPRFSTSSQP